MVVPSNKKLKKNIRRRRTYSGFVPEIVEGYNRVCIGNLAWDTTERDIHELFSGCVINSVLWIRFSVIRKGSSCHSLWQEA
ncbi:BnaCnng67700D [Brassica napus]|uniref:(rape) hypothetical protein n=1 Tax=Brassica napus TaxID=3708 RepID=A0A078JXG9_BRANA|nr:unnamed protein product [Brassica napus]CDY70302.1 BnaCnng67700D [Brassica napus]